MSNSYDFNTAMQDDPAPHSLAYDAWVIIANAGVHLGGWDAEHPEWVAAAIRWRDRYHDALARSNDGDLVMSKELAQEIATFLREQQCPPDEVCESLGDKCWEAIVSIKITNIEKASGQLASCLWRLGYRKNDS